MKKMLIAAGLFLATSVAWTQDFELTINGTTTGLSLDEPIQVTLPDGSTAEVLLHQKEQLTFRSELFSFQHANKFRPTKSTLGPGLDQTLVVSPMGTGIIVQEYRSLNPSGLVDLMIREVTKDEVKAGYDYQEEAIERTAGETKFTGKKAITTQGDSQWEREVLVIGNEDRGVLVVTFIEKGQLDNERPILKQFWESLKISL